jgi:AraC-like DNA-binding protein
VSGRGTTTSRNGTTSRCCTRASSGTGSPAIHMNTSSFHLARAFEKDVGLPPHVYLDMVRTQRARSLLDAGNPIADVAVAVGYADQSHLTHRFKRLLGITPGQYARERKIRQDCRIP